MKLLIILFVVLFAVILAFVQGLQAKDRKLNHSKTNGKLSKKWHMAQAGLHVLVAVAVFLVSLPDIFSACFGFFMTLFTTWTVFDVINNLVTGNKAFYHGQSSFLDRLLNKIPAVAEILIKGVLIIVTTTYFIKNPYNG